MAFPPAYHGVETGDPAMPPLSDILIFSAALIAAGTLTWRRHAAAPVRVEAEIEGPTCYPRVKR